jgi:hypothetical protein
MASPSPTWSRHIVRAGEDGITIPDLVNLTGLRYRVLHNVAWTLEGAPEPSRRPPNYGVPEHPDAIRARRQKRATALSATSRFEPPGRDAGSAMGSSGG